MEVTTSGEEDGHTPPYPAVTFLPAAGGWGLSFALEANPPHDASGSTLGFSLPTPPPPAAAAVYPSAGMVPHSLNVPIPQH